MLGLSLRENVMFSRRVEHKDVICSVGDIEKLLRVNLLLNLMLVGVPGGKPGLLRCAVPTRKRLRVARRNNALVSRPRSLRRQIMLHRLENARVLSVNFRLFFGLPQSPVEVKAQKVASLLLLLST